MDWKDMTDDQKDRKRERERLYRKTPHAKKMKAVREKRYREKNKEKIRGNNREYQRKWREKNKDNVSEYNRKYRESHKEKLLELNRKWRKEHPENVKAYRRQFKESHPEYNSVIRERYAIRRLDPEFMAHKYARQREYFEAHREQARESDRRRRKTLHYIEYQRQRARDNWQKQRLLFARDAIAYQRRLQKSRDYTRRKAESEGRVYRPLLSMRLPHWCVFGITNHIRSRSTFIRENNGKSRLIEFDGTAREIYDSRRQDV